MTWLRECASFFHAVAFLTRIPVPILTDSKKDWQRSTAYFPLVGLLIGCILVGFSMAVERVFPRPLSTVLILVVWVCLTGGLHLDGWMDLADGLFSNRSKDRILEIMKDSRVGAMGVLAAILLLFIKTAAIFDLQDLQLQKWILIAPLYARAGLILVIRFFPYIREQGMGSELAQGLTSRRLTCSILFVVVAPVILFLFQPKALILGELIGILTVLFGFALAKWIQFRLGGLTGDCYGAIVESTEVWALLLVIGLQKWVP